MDEGSDTGIDKEVRRSAPKFRQERGLVQDFGSRAPWMKDLIQELTKKYGGRHQKSAKREAGAGLWVQTSVDKNIDMSQKSRQKT